MNELAGLLSAAASRRGAAVGAAVAGVAAGLAALAASDGVAAGRFVMGDGGAWLPSASVGQVVLIDGTTGRVAARVEGVGTEKLAVAQAGADGIVVDASRGLVHRISGEDQALMELRGGGTGVPYQAAERVLVGGDTAYVLAPAARTVHALHARTLAPLSTQPQGLAGENLSAAVDADDTLWLLDRDAGRVQAVADGELRAYARLDGMAGHDADLVLAGRVPVVVDRSTAEVVEIDPRSGRARRTRECPWFASGDRVEVAGTTSARPWLSIAVPLAGNLFVTDLSGDRCPTPVRLADQGDNQFGTPVEADGRVYVPVISTGSIVVVDPTVPAVVATTVVVDPGTFFELVVEDGRVFYNAPFSHQAGTIGREGEIQPVDKFDPGGASGRPEAAQGDGLRCSVSAAEVAPGIEVGFTGSISGQPVAGVVWDFGDTRSSTANPTAHSYARAGTYHASVRADGATGACPPVVVDPAHADPDRLIAKVSGPRQAVVGQPVTFADASTGDVASRSWALPGAEPNGGADPRITAVYRKVGVHKVRLTVTGRGETTDTDERTVEVLARPGSTTTTSTTPTTPTTPTSTIAPPELPKAPTPPPPAPAGGSCKPPAPALSATATLVTPGQSATFRLSPAAAEGVCPTVLVRWDVGGPLPLTSESDDTYTHTFRDVGSYEVAPTVTYRTESGSTAAASSSPPSVRVSVERAAVAFEPPAVDFGRRYAGGPEARRSVTLRNTGGTEVTITAAPGSSATADFASYEGGCVPVTLKPGGSCTFEIGFKPQDLGARTSVREFALNGEAGSASLAMSGIGTRTVGLARSSSGKGLVTVEFDGHLSTRGNVTCPGQPRVVGRAVGVAVVTMETGQDCLVATAENGVFGVTRADPGPKDETVVAIVPTPTHRGYWLVTLGGGLRAFGDAEQFATSGSSTGSFTAMAATMSGSGFYLVASDGGLVTLGDADFQGSLGGTGTPTPVVGIATAVDGYWMVTSGGQLYGFGKAAAAPWQPPAMPVIAIVATPVGKGFWVAAADGSVYAYGDAPFFGS